MKKILFDLLNAQPAGTSKFHGGGEYIKTVFERFVNKYCDEYEIIVFYDIDKFLDNWVKKIIEEKNIKVYNINRIEEIKNIFDKEKDIDIYYSGLPYTLKKGYIPEKVMKVGTIHGLRPIEVPLDTYTYLYTNKPRYLINKIKLFTGFELNKNKKMYLESINLLDKIICVSEHSKYSICNYFKDIQLNKIEVFYTPEKITNVKIEEKVNNDKYILMLGGDRWIKNTFRAIKAIEGLISDGKLEQYKVIIVGKVPKKVKKYVKHINKYEILDYVETEKLEELYKNCDIFLYPTLNEGFGMPPLEAMKYGKTCIVSAVTSLPEVCGNAVYYTNPYDIYEIRNRILHAIDEKIPVELINNQLDRINKKQKEDLEKICEYIVK